MYSVMCWRLLVCVCLQWLCTDFLEYLAKWEQEIASIPGLKAAEKQRMCLSRETRKGLKITINDLCLYCWGIVLQAVCLFPPCAVMAFTELGPKLLKVPGVSYLLSEDFSQDPLERYFSRQRHRGGSNENPTALQVPYNAATLLQQSSIYKDLKTMSVMAEGQNNLENVCRPLRKKQQKEVKDFMFHVFVMVSVFSLFLISLSNLSSVYQKLKQIIENSITNNDEKHKRVVKCIQDIIMKTRLSSLVSEFSLFLSCTWTQISLSNLLQMSDREHSSRVPQLLQASKCYTSQTWVGYSQPPSPNY